MRGYAQTTQTYQMPGLGFIQIQIDFIEVQLICNVLISAAWQSDLVMYMYILTLILWFNIMDNIIYYH